MTILHELCDPHGQSPWLDELQRSWLKDGTLARLVERGVRGVTSNPTRFEEAISGSDAYDHQFRELLASGLDVPAAYWDLVITDIVAASTELEAVHDSSGGRDGFVSVELGPHLADDTEASIESARDLHRRIKRPNVFVKVPATAQGVPAIERLIAEGFNTNVTLVFSLDRYDEVIEAYLRGLERHEGDLSRVHSVASFFVSRVDTEVDQRLESIDTPEARELQGRAAIAQAKLAYRLFRERFSGERWQRLADRGANLQRPLWASTSTKNPEHPDTRYVESLVGPDTVDTMPLDTLEAFVDHGRLARTLDTDVDVADAELRRLVEVGIDLDDVTRVLEEEGVAKFAKSFDSLLATMEQQSAEVNA